MERFDCTPQEPIGQSRLSLRLRIAALLEVARTLDAPLARYHLKRGLSVLGLRRDRDALDDLAGGSDR
jgi:hypothetical protein